MKSYLRFLSRNKLYTAIEVIGISISLAFVIVLGSYLLNDLNYDRCIMDSEEVHIVRNKSIMNEFLVRHDLTEDMASSVPGIQDVCQIVREELNWNRDIFTAQADTGKQEYSFNSLMAADRNFFSFLTLPLTYGDPAGVLSGNKMAAISENLAHTMFGDENPIGRKILIHFSTSTSDEYVVNGIYPAFRNTTIPDSDIIIGIEDHKNCQKKLFNNSSEDPRVQLIRIDRKADKDAVRNSLQDILTAAAGREDYYDIDLVSLKDYHRREGYASYERAKFGNIRNSEAFNLYLLICLMLGALSLLNYILLTVAYSHFRMKEIATRQLLGTERRGIIIRCTLEALFLIMISMVVAALLAVGLEGVFSKLLDIDLDPMRSIGEYIILITLAVLMALPSGLAASVAVARYSPIDIIKGQKRKEEKAILSKLFIALEGGLAIASTAILIAVIIQNLYLKDYPMGYEKEHLIHIDFKNRMPRHIDKVRDLAFVEEVGQIYDPPMLPYRVRFPKDGNSIGFVVGERSIFSMLGIEINDYGEDVFDMFGQAFYLSNETMDAIPGAVENKEWLIDQWGGKTAIAGTCSHYILGEAKNIRGNSLCGAELIAPWRAESSPEENNLLVKVTGEEREACIKIKELYKNLGYEEHLVSVKSLDQYLEESLRKERNLLNLLLAYVLASLLLTSMAIAAFSSYYAQLRTQDTAIRKVFGESRCIIFRNTVWGFISPVLYSAVAAIPAAYVIVSRWLEGYAVRIGNSWTIYACALVFVLFVVAISATIHTISLIRTNPALILKKE